MKLILASESPGRRRALEEAEFVFDVVPSDFVEDMTLPLTPAELVVRLSRGKAWNVAERFKNDEVIVIGADTVGVFENVVLGKPHTKENGRKMLAMLSGNVHSMITGLTVINCKTKKEISRSTETKIWFKEISPEKIAEYTETEEGLKKAGGYAYQANGQQFIDRIEGSESNIIGLPIEGLKEMLRKLL